MSADQDFTVAEWFASSHSSSSGGQCVEFSRSFTRSGVVPVRDSKNLAARPLVVRAPSWSSFVTAVKCGDLPAL